MNPAISLSSATEDRTGRRAVLALSIGHFSVDFYQGVVPAILPYLVTERNYTFTAVGALIFAFNLASSIVQPIFGRLADKRSMHWLLPGGLTVAGLGILLVGMLEDRWAASLVAVFAGIGVAAFHPEAARLVRKASGTRSKARAMSVFATGGASGFAFGPLVASWAFAQFGLWNGCLLLLVPLVAMLIYSLVELPHILARTGAAGTRPPVAAAITEEDEEEVDPAQPAVPVRVVTPPAQADQWGAFWWLCVAVICRSIIFFGLLAFLPLYWLKVLQGSEAGGGRLVALLFLNGVIGALIGGWCGDRFGHRRVVLLGFVAMIPMLILLPYLQSPVPLVIGVALIGICLYVPYSVLVVLGQEYLPNHVGLASGVTLGLTVTIGGLFSPVLGWLADRYGIPAMLLGVAAMPVLALIATLFMPEPTSHDAGTTPDTPATSATPARG